MSFKLSHWNVIPISIYLKSLEEALGELLWPGINLQTHSLPSAISLYLLECLCSCSATGKVFSSNFWKQPWGKQAAGWFPMMLDASPGDSVTRSLAPPLCQPPRWVVGDAHGKEGECMPLGGSPLGGWGQHTHMCDIPAKGVPSKCNVRGIDFVTVEQWEDLLPTIFLSIFCPRSRIVWMTSMGSFSCCFQVGPSNVEPHKEFGGRSENANHPSHHRQYTVLTNSFKPAPNAFGW